MSTTVNFQPYFDKPITSIEDLHHVGNNRIFKIIVGENAYACKHYSTKQKDNWDRGKIEYNAFSYLWKRGINCVPAPVAFDEKEHVGIYKWVDGKVIDINQIDSSDIATAAHFLAQIHLSNSVDKESFPKGRTSCFSPSDWISLLQGRYNTLCEDFAGTPAQFEFLEKRVRPKIQKLVDGLIKDKEHLYEKGGLSLETQVITPGDFGFHNALFQERKRCTFIDFEYFGRDDPAKQVADFFHHARSRGISPELKAHFLKTYETETSEREEFRRRLLFVDPLVGMDWTLIYLNPLSKKYQEHLRFSHNTDVDFEKIIAERIVRAHEKLEHPCIVPSILSS